MTTQYLIRRVKTIPPLGEVCKHTQRKLKSIPCMLVLLWYWQAIEWKIPLSTNKNYAQTHGRWRTKMRKHLEHWRELFSANLWSYPSERRVSQKMVNEFYKLCRDMDILVVQRIKIQQMRQLDHVVRTEDDAMARSSFDLHP